MKRAEDLRDLGAGLIISYSDNILTFRSGVAQAEIVAESVATPEYDQGSWRGELEQKGERRWVAFTNSSWNPDEPGEDTLVVSDLESLTVRKIPDSQPDRPMTLIVDGEVVDQDDWEVSYSSQSNPEIQTGVLGIPRPLFSALGNKPPLRILLEDLEGERF